MLHAWTFDAGDISPFMVVNSLAPNAVGRRRSSILLYFLTPKSRACRHSITASSLFRYIEQVRPTLIIDEADTFMGDNEELRGILNSGHTKTAANVIRNVEVEGEHRPRRFSTWAPKVIAAIGSLADTLEDRSIILLLQRKPRTAKVDRLRRRDTIELAGLRSQAARWAADNFDLLIDPIRKSHRRSMTARRTIGAPCWQLPTWRAGRGHKTRARPPVTYRATIRTAPFNVDLLKDIRTAFGEEMRPFVRPTSWRIDCRPRAAMGGMEARAIADPEAARQAPETLWNLLRDRPPARIAARQGLPAGSLRGGLGSVLPLGQSAPHSNPPFSKCASVQMPMKSAQHGDFRSVQKASPHTSKNEDLSYGYAGLHGCTLRKQQNGVGGHVDRADDPAPSRFPGERP